MAIIFEEETANAIIDAGVPEIDIISLEISTSLLGANPPNVETSFADAINDFDLRVDTDDNGAAGPHRLELDTVTTTTSAAEGADEVALGLGLDGVSLVLGDFNVPLDCLSPTLVGISAHFPAEPSE